MERDEEFEALQHAYDEACDAEGKAWLVVVGKEKRVSKEAPAGDATEDAVRVWQAAHDRRDVFKQRLDEALARRRNSEA